MNIFRVLLCGSLCAAALSFGPRQALAQQPVTAILSDARRQLDELKPDSAALILVRVLEASARASQGERVRALVLLGIAELIMSHPDRARLTFQQALALDPRLRVDSLADLQTSLLTTFDAARLSAAGGADPRPATLSRDADGDGVTDNLDRCPDTPANARPVDASGCPLDSDRDGVADYLDRCANTAAGTQVDANGCPVMRDADRDGVIDGNDRCPNTPAASRVDANGCPLAELPPVNAALVIASISFRAGSAALLPTSYADLDRIAAAIVATPRSRWEIGGYTSSTGTSADNLRLSLANAQAVAQYLIGRGVPAGALTVTGHGSANPVAPNNTAAGRAQNWRVEIKRIS